VDLNDDESEDDGYDGPKKLLKKRKIENDGLDGLGEYADIGTRALTDGTYRKTRVYSSLRRDVQQGDQVCRGR
jgi:hypothetical protein